jgi:hypothetical protein
VKIHTDGEFAAMQIVFLLLRSYSACAASSSRFGPHSIWRRNAIANHFSEGRECIVHVIFNDVIPVTEVIGPPALSPA